MTNPTRSGSYQVTPQHVIQRVDRLAAELNQKSGWLHEIEMQLAPAEDEYTRFVDDYELGLLRKSETSEYKLPSEALRLKLARSEMSADLLGRYEGLRKKRRRLEQRLKDIRVEIDAQRSILSALKVMEDIK